MAKSLCFHAQNLKLINTQVLECGFRGDFPYRASFPDSSFTTRCLFFLPVSSLISPASSLLCWFSVARRIIFEMNAYTQAMFTGMSHLCILLSCEVLTLDIDLFFYLLLPPEKVPNKYLKVFCFGLNCW